jgi:putative transposase
VHQARKRVRAIIRQFGYPTKNALKGRCREFERRLDLPVGYAGRCPKYSHALWAPKPDRPTV